MIRLHDLKSGLWVGVPAALIVAGTLLSRGGGIQSGSSGAPLDSAKMQPSCSACHSGSHGGPQVSLTVTKHALQPGEAISATSSATGGASGTTGGFVCEVTGGTFTPGSTSHILTNSASITHTDNSNRSWTYGYTAPSSPGLIEMFAVVNTTNGSGRSGDQYAFSGFDTNATIGTPVRLFVLPQGVTNVGNGCPDGFGNVSVLGASGVPSVGNSSFTIELHGATPTSLGFVLAGFNPSGFVPIDLGAAFGLLGCHGFVANPVSTLSGLTSGGSAQRGDGTATFALPIPSLPLQGLAVDLQGAYIDPSAQSSLGRSFPVSFSNGLKVTIQ